MAEGEPYLALEYIGTVAHAVSGGIGLKAAQPSTRVKKWQSSRMKIQDPCRILVLTSGYSGSDCGISGAPGA
jgi:hypothetical protein